MIIGIDAQSLAYGTGVSNYTQNLISHLLDIDQHNQYKIFFSSLRSPLPDFLANLPQQYSNVKIYHFHFPPKFFEIFWNKIHIFKIEKFIGPCDIFHTSDWTQPPTSTAKTVCTIHDLTPFLFPQWHHIKTILNHNSKMAWANLEASRFICVSQNTTLDLKKFFPKIKNHQITTIYEAADDIYNHVPNVSQIEEIKQKYQLDQYFFAQGTREPRKNLHRLIKAFVNFKQQFPDSKIKLVITGKYGWGNDIAPHPDIVCTGYVSDHDLYLLHAAAFCLVYPSLYEGFGLPIIKSMKLKVPVITSRNSSLGELANNSAILINPKSTASICQGLTKIFQNQKLYQKLQTSAFEHSQQFSWTSTAQQTLAVYQQLYDHRH